MNKERLPSRFFIRFEGAPYANELYGETGDYVYDLDEAIHQAEIQFGPFGWEIWNGSGEHSRLKVANDAE